MSLPTFNLDSILSKATEALEKAAEDNIRKAEQAEDLIDLINDQGLRASVQTLLLNGGLIATTVGARLKDIFETDEEPEEEDEPEEEEPVSDEAEAAFRDLFGDPDSALASLIEAIQKAKGQGLGGSTTFNIFPDDEQGFGQPRRPFGL